MKNEKKSLELDQEASESKRSNFMKPTFLNKSPKPSKVSSLFQFSTSTPPKPPLRTSSVNVIESIEKEGKYFIDKIRPRPLSMVDSTRNVKERPVSSPTQTTIQEELTNIEILDSLSDLYLNDYETPVNTSAKKGRSKGSKTKSNNSNPIRITGVQRPIIKHRPLLAPTPTPSEPSKNQTKYSPIIMGGFQPVSPTTKLSDVTASGIAEPNSKPRESLNEILSTTAIKPTINFAEPPNTANEQGSTSIDPSPSSTLRTNVSNLASSDTSMLLAPSVAASTVGSIAPSSKSLVFSFEENQKGWGKVYNFFTGWINKNKKPTVPSKNSESDHKRKRLNEARLVLIQERIQASKSDYLPHTEVHFLTYAPLFTLKLISILFADDAARQRLKKANKFKWGLRYKLSVDFVEIDAPFENQCGPRMVGQRLAPSEYIARVVKESWKALLKIGRSGNPKDEISGKANRRKCVWFLRQFCIIYGFAVVRLGLTSLHMLQQLMMIALFPELSQILPFNEDTVYCLESIKLDHKSQLIHRRHSNFGRRSSPLRAPSMLLNNNGRSPNGSIRYSSRNSVTAKIAPLPNLPLMSTEEEAVVTLEHVVLHMLECLTRSRSPIFPPTLFNQLIQSVPNLECSNKIEYRDELLVSADYLLQYEFVIAPERWFRESCDQQELVNLNQLGLVKYLEQLTTKLETEKIAKPKYGTIKAKDTYLDLTTPLLEATIDPRLVASHLKHLINSMSGLICIPVANAIMALMPSTPRSRSYSTGQVRDMSKDGAEWWLPELEVLQLINSLLSLSPIHFQLLQKIVQLSQVLLPPPPPSPTITANATLGRPKNKSNKRERKLLHTTNHSNPNSNSTELDQSNITAHGLAIVLPVIPIHLFSDLGELKRWNFVWGHLLNRGKDLILDPQIQEITNIPLRLRKGYQFTMEILKETGVTLLPN